MLESERKDPILCMRGISKRFPGVQALQNVSVDLYRREVHAILGENGAGKSTLIKILGGIYTADEGDIYINGEKVFIHDVIAARAHGISVIHQELCMAGNMTVADNIFLGREPLFRGIKIVNQKKILESTREILDQLEIEGIVPDDLVSNLSISQQQMVEIAKALAINASIVVMDEPTSSLTEVEVQRLFQFIRKCKKERGLAFIYISHRMDEIFELSDRITVLRDGAYIETLDTKTADMDLLIKLMVGRDIKEMYHMIELRRTADKLLEVKNLSSDLVSNINFDLYNGEILGIFGLMGAGRTELSRALFGIDRIRFGEIVINNKRAPKNYNPETAIQMGLALVPESRKEHGLILIESIQFNMLLSVLNKVFRFLRINKKFIDETISDYFNTLSIKANSSEDICQTLSGGNQQKIVLSKWLATNPRVLILDEPTRGIDVGAKSEIYSIIQRLAERGIGIIFISSELPEMINVCTRVMVMHEGRISAFLEKTDIKQEKIMHYAVGGK